MMKRDKIYQNGKKSKLVLSEKDRLYEKKLIYCGDFIDGDHEFSINKELLEHWVDTFHEMRNNGLKIPVPLGHSFNAEDERGEVVDLYIKDDSLYGKIEFFDGVDVTPLVNSDVSIEVPAEIKDGKGNIYKEAIRHVALTSYPVVPHLDQFLKLSLIKKSENNMKNKKLSQIIKTLSLEPDADIKEIVAAIEKLEEEVEEVKEEVTDKSLENTDVQKEEDIEELKEEIKKEIIEEIKQETLELETKNDEEDEEKKELKLSLLKLSNQNRKLEIDNLVKDGYISVATKNHLEKKFCSEKSKLSLSMIDDNFSDVVEILKMQGKLKYGEETRGQVLSCSLNKQDNPLIRDAESRNKK